MANFAPAFQHEGNADWLNNIVGDIIDPAHRGSCRTYGQDIDDDLVDDPNYPVSEPDSEHTITEQDYEKERNASKTPTSPVPVIPEHQEFNLPDGSVPPRQSSTNRLHKLYARPSSRTSRLLSSATHRSNSRTSSTRTQSPPRVHHRPSQTFHSPNSAFLVSQSSANRSDSPVGRILDDGTLAQAKTPHSYRSYNKLRRNIVSPQPSIRSPAPPYDEVVNEKQLNSQTHTRALHRSYSSQGWRIPEDQYGLRKLDSAASQFSGFAPHPAVRPLASRAALGEAAGPITDDESEYPAPLPLAMIIIGICLSVFVISLDRNIITTAIPRITERFHSYDDIGWYGSAYLLTASAFQPLYGRIYMAFETKLSFLAALAVFEIGSIIGAVAPSSSILIVGRAIQGLGSAGILTGSFVVGTHSVRLQKRPILFAFVGILYGTGALCGPLLGGAFTDTIGWRWCFWINLPVGLITFLTVFFFFKSRPPANNSDKRPSWIHRVLALDLIGNAILLAACTMLFLALQFSESRFDWSSAPIIGLLTGFGVTTLIFIGWMFYKGDSALIPPRIARQRTVAASCGAAFFIYGTTLIHAYYLPIWFQAIKGSSATNSGVNMIPYMLSNFLFGLLAGIFVSKNGLFAPPAILGCAIGTIGCGFLATLHPDTSTAKWIGYEILISTGLGMAIQQGFSAVQTALPLNEVPIGTAAVVASQSAGGAIFVSVGNTLLQNHLLAENNANSIPGVNIRTVIEQGTTMFRSTVPAEALPALIRLYNESLQAVFIAAVPLCGVAFLCSLCMEWRSVRGKQEETGLNIKNAKKGVKGVEAEEEGEGEKA